MKIANNNLLNKKTAITKLFLTMSFAVTFNELVIAQSTSYGLNSSSINGNRCTAFGYEVLFYNTGDNNSATGYNAMRANTVGSSNTAMGSYSLWNNTVGSYNTAMGYNALWFNYEGNYNTAVGFGALTYNGFDANVSLEEGVKNTAIGASSMYSNTKGFYNTALGVSSLYANTSGFYNSAIGYGALASNVDGHDNTAIGLAAANVNINGHYNTATGTRSLSANTSGSNNTANGYYALKSNINGNYNTALGESAGYSSTGSGNVFLGYQAGYAETRSNQLYIGNNQYNTILYGNFSTGQVLLGKPDPTGYIFIGNRTLNVLGGILADSMRLALSGSWADHVLSPEYPLQPLDEVEKYTKVNKHLPNIPSEKEVKENGIDVAAMNAKLLEKIEELYLYVIRQQKQINELKQQVENIKK